MHFEEIQQANDWQLVARLATNEIGFDGSFQALEYLLIKAGVTEDAASTLFYPSVELVQGKEVHDIDVDAMDGDELFDYYSNALTYTMPKTVGLLWQAVQAISVEQISSLYNSQELRAKGIYPWNWHDDESENQAFNRRHITQDYQALQKFYEAASHAGDYVFYTVD